MPVQTIPLAGGINSRVGSAAYSKDQVFKGGFFEIANNSVTGSKTAYLNKRGAVAAPVSTGASAAATAIWASPSTGFTVTAYGGTTSTIYLGTTNAGSLTTNSCCAHISETIIGTTTYYLFQADGIEGWYLPHDAATQTAYTGDTHTNTTVDNIASTAGMYVGQAITGSGFQAGTRIATIVGANSITITLATSSSLSGTALTKTPIAKIIDADFPTSGLTGEFIELSGTIYIQTTDGKIYGSDLNSVSSWTATNFISANLYTDGGIGLAKDGDKIISFGQKSAEWFYNAGNPTGSLLSKTGRSMQTGATAPSMSVGVIYAAISSAGPVICWGYAAQGSAWQIWMMDGGSPRKISNSFVEKIIYANAPNCINSFAYQGDMYIFVAVLSGGVNYNLCYSIGTGLWTDAAFHDNMLISGISTALNLVEYTGTTGNYYRLGVDGSTADSVGTKTLTVQTAGLDFGTDKRKLVSAIWLDADTQASGTATLEASDDDFATFVTLGTFDMTKHEKKITRCGSHKGERSYRLTHSANTAFRAKSLRVEYTVGT